MDVVVVGVVGVGGVGGVVGVGVHSYRKRTPGLWANRIGVGIGVGFGAT